MILRLADNGKKEAEKSTRLENENDQFRLRECVVENGEDFVPSFTGESTDNGNLVKLSACEIIEAQLRSEESAHLIRGTENGASDEASDQEGASLQLIPVRHKVSTELYVDRIGPLPVIPGYKHILSDVGRRSCSESSEEVGEKGLLESRSPTFRIDSSGKDMRRTGFEGPDWRRRHKRALYWSELIPLRKASARVIANAFFENYISRYGAPISFISDNCPQFISDVFEHLSHRLDIKHIKTVTYRPQANFTERVNRTLVEMIACFVEENHVNWDRFLHEFFFALRTSVNETVGKTPAELFLGRKIITHFSKLINVTKGAEYVGGNIEKVFDEARQNMRKQHKTWEKYYNRKRREANIKANDLVLVQTHFISAPGRRVDGKFMPKFEGPYRVLEVRNHNLITWKKGRRVTVNIDQVQMYHPRQSDTISFDSNDETLMKERGLVLGRVGHTREIPKVLEKPRLMRGSEHRDRKRQTPVLPQGIKRAVTSSVASRNHKYRRHNNPSQGPESIAGPSHQQMIGQFNPPTEESRRRARVPNARETRTTRSKGQSAAERKPVQSRQTTAVRPCPYYLRRSPKEYQRSQGALVSAVYLRTASGEETSAWKP
ncbi:retrovirus-related Pol polyprotein from transposon 412 [Trichonephila clavipes]|nr:retrovirus-related Pol polyprotein from transposon 412 [Trichonephila clavipes]